MGSSDVIDTLFTNLQDLKVPKKDGGSRRGSFNPAEGAADGDAQPEVSNLDFVNLKILC